VRGTFDFRRRRGINRLCPLEWPQKVRFITSIVNRE
jgi:hypothetical protein